MRSKRFGLSLGLVLVVAVGAFAGPGGGDSSPSPHHPPLGKSPSVTGLAQSTDAQRVAAAYYVRPMNRPGTDWDAWVALWDLAARRRTILSDACAPVSVSPDGNWVAARRYERSNNPGFLGYPPGEIALWRFGDEKATKVLLVPGASATPLATQPSHVVAGTDAVRAVVFASDSHRVFGLIGDGRIIAWPVEGDAHGIELARIVVSDCQIVPPTRLGSSMALERTSRGLLAVVPMTPVGRKHRDHQADLLTMAIELRWHGPDQLEQVGEIGPFASDPSLAYAQSILGAFFPRKEPLAIPLPATIFRGITRPSRWIPAPCVALDPKNSNIALAEEGLIRVHKVRDRELVASLPGVEPMLFSPDGKLLLIPNRAGVLRLWDVERGVIVRSLRLDDLPPETFCVAAIQYAPKFGDPATNLKELASRVFDAAARGAEVVVLPETAITGYMSSDLKRTWQVGQRSMAAGLTGADPKDVAEPVPGPSTQFFGNLAKRCGIYLTVPLVEADRKTGRYYNTVVLLGPDGSQVIHYRKLNPWPWAEQGWATPGNLGLPIADTPFGRFGTLICFDIHEQAPAMAELKVDTILYSIAWVDDHGSDWFPRKLPKIAAKNCFNIIGANWTIPPRAKDEAPPPWHGYGQSCIISTDGQVLAKSRQEAPEETVFADLRLPAAQEQAK